MIPAVIRCPRMILENGVRAKAAQPQSFRRPAVIGSTELQISLLILLAVAQENLNELTPGERADGWTLLFDGASTKGWLEVTGKPFPAKSWRVEDGCLRAVDPGGGFQDLRTERELSGSYEFQFDWKIAAGSNSGVKYLVQRVDDWTNAAGRQARARGFEYQLFDDAVEPDHDPRKISGSLYEAIAPAKAAVRPVGEFNHSLLRVREGQVEHWLNGVKVVGFALDSAEAQLALTRAMGKKPKQDPPPGNFISLQNHGTPVWFRGLKLRELTSEKGAP